MDKDENDALRQKWGNGALKMGWTAIPTLLLFRQNELGISPLAMNVLIQLIAHWWKREEKPFPSQANLAERIGVSKRSVQRALVGLEERGLIQKVSITRDRKGSPNTRNEYDLVPLADLLVKL